jgi:hypothetical protein
MKELSAPGVVGTVPPSPEAEIKQSSQRQATNYGNKACDNRMPLDTADREIEHGAHKESQCNGMLHFSPTLYSILVNAERT